MNNFKEYAELFENAKKNPAKEFEIAKKKAEKEYFRLLNQYKSKLTKQQYKTFKGQILSGDTNGFVKGLQKVLYRK
jgi:hypothetical protein